jgi:septal ring factor EnvC (AmiA/AmiB activator)
MRRLSPTLLALSAALLVPVVGAASPGASPDAKLARRRQALIAEQQAKVEMTRGLIEDKIELRRGERRSRARALYKLARASFPRVWVDAGARLETSRWLGAARRIARRDRDELGLLDEELAVATEAATRLRAEASEETPALPDPNSLSTPVSGARIVASMGRYQHAWRGVTLRRRGVELDVAAGARVHAIGAGRVRYAGPISGKELGVIVEHDGYWSITAELRTVEVARDDQVRASTSLGTAASDRLYLELRVGSGEHSMAIDPAPLLVEH